MALRKGVLLKQEFSSKSWMEHYVVLHYNSLLIYQDIEALARGTPIHWTSLQSLCVSVADADDKKCPASQRVFYIRLYNAGTKFCVLLGSRSENARNEWFASILMVMTHELIRRRDNCTEQVCSNGYRRQDSDELENSHHKKSSNGGRRRSLSMDGAMETTMKFLSNVPKLLHLPRRGRAVSCPIDPDLLRDRKEQMVESQFYRCTSQEVVYEE